MGPFEVVEYKSEVTYLVDLRTPRNPMRILHVKHLKPHFERTELTMLVLTNDGVEEERKPLPGILFAKEKDRSVEGVNLSSSLTPEQQRDCYQVLGSPENESEPEAPPSTPANSRNDWPPEATKTPGPEPTPSKPPNLRGWHWSSLPPGEEEIKTPLHEDEPAPATIPTPGEQTPTQESVPEEDLTPETNERETSSSGKENETVPTALEKSLTPNDPADATTEGLWEPAVKRTTTPVTGAPPTASPTQSPSPEESEIGPREKPDPGKGQNLTSPS
ncbi:brain acid soluble protein 1 homolog [Pleurodeles waltl]|uniref:brain acid soluble protein 1 homolog n=1 Tax=Pleurodeles waltl TaxID=8319 RepID=UPI0037099FF7